MKVLVKSSEFSLLIGNTYDVLDVDLNEYQEIILCLDANKNGLYWVKKSDTEVKPTVEIIHLEQKESFIEFTKEQRDNLIINALEGGSNYWCIVDPGNLLLKTKEEEENRISFAERVIKTVECGGPVSIWDAEAKNKKLGLINLKNLKTAEKLMFVDFKSHYEDVINENDDATTADVFLQLVVMGNVIFG